VGCSLHQLPVVAVAMAGRKDVPPDISAEVQSAPASRAAIDARHRNPIPRIELLAFVCHAPSLLSAEGGREIGSLPPLVIAGHRAKPEKMAEIFSRSSLRPAIG